MGTGAEETTLEGQVAIITGAGQGIGRATALRLAADGMDLVLADRNGPAIEALAGEVRARGRRAVAMTMDVTDAGARARLIEGALAELGRLDALVNNAGVLRASAPLEASEEHWDLVLAVNAKAVYFLCQLVMGHMLAAGGGRIVNLASAAGKSASTIHHPVYNVSKAAVIAMTKTFAHIGAPYGVRVNAVCPGIIATPMQDQVDAEFGRLLQRAPEQIRAERTTRIPLGRSGEPDEVAALVAFLVGPDSRYMTGQALNVTGGMIMY
jgi:NAD(P)-dependent dehydrogenase (short-subunit alcohol dehydrogenase family)